MAERPAYRMGTARQWREYADAIEVRLAKYEKALREALKEVTPTGNASFVYADRLMKAGAILRAALAAQDSEPEEGRKPPGADPRAQTGSNPGDQTSGSEQHPEGGQ